MAKKKDKLKAWGYIRVSTDEQKEEGVSLDAQEAKIKAWAEIKDMDLVEVIRDEGLSGKNLDDRPGIQKLMELAEGPETEAVIVYKLDRLSRRTRDLLYLIEDVFKKGNTRFFSITENIDTKTAMGKFFLTMMGALAQMERETISERTKAALAFKKERGDPLGTVPYGFKLEDGKFKKVPEEQKIVKKIQRLRKKGKSIRKITAILNKENIKPKRAKKWNPSSVHYLLKRTGRKKKVPPLKNKKQV